MNSKLRIGTCSWKYDSWKGLVYPDFGDFNYLEEYAKHYNTVEVDQWFWSLHGKKVTLPNPRVVEEYNSSTPDDFKFTIKAPNSLTLTHHYKSTDPNRHFLSTDLMESFLSSLDGIKSKIGMLMFQFEYLNKQKMPSYEEFEKQFSDFRNSFESEIPIGIEIRNPNYLHERFFAFLNYIKVAPVLLQGYYMPQITEVYEQHKSFFNDSVVIRLHGYDRKGIEKKTNKIWNTIVDSKDSELTSIVKMFLELFDKDVEVYANVNNHYEGSAPLTIEKINDQFNY